MALRSYMSTQLIAWMGYALPLESRQSSSQWGQTLIRVQTPFRSRWDSESTSRRWSVETQRTVSQSMPMSWTTRLTGMVPGWRVVVWQATGREEQSRLSTSSWVRRPWTWTVAYSCPQYGTRSWTHPDQPLGCPEYVLVGPCPLTPWLLLLPLFNIHYSSSSLLLLLLLLLMTCHLSLHPPSPYDVMVAVYIRPNHLFSSAL